ncbi:MAG: hypothetical protein QXD07_06250, partial [Thermoplasmata archaeon]
TEGNFSEECKVPKGHFRNPFSWEDLNEKGLKIIKDEDLVNSIMNAGKTLDKITINELLDVVTNVNSKK